MSFTDIIILIGIILVTGFTTTFIATSKVYEKDKELVNEIWRTVILLLLGLVFGITVLWGISTLIPLN